MKEKLVVVNYGTSHPSMLRLPQSSLLTDTAPLIGCWISTQQGTDGESLYMEEDSIRTDVASRFDMGRVDHAVKNFISCNHSCSCSKPFIA